MKILKTLWTRQGEIAASQQGNNLCQETAMEDKNKKNKNKWKKKKRICMGYCWSYGATNHEFKDCRTPMDGHQKLATFEDKVRGSTNFSKWERWDDILGILNNDYQNYISSHTSHLYQFLTEKGDSAASAHYWRENDISCLTQIQTAPRLAVTLTNNTNIRANEQGTIPINASLSLCAKIVVVLLLKEWIINILRETLWWRLSSVVW